MKNSKLIAVTLSVSILAACTEPNGEPGRGVEHGGAVSKADVGTVGGAVAGGLIGSTIGGGVGQGIAIVGGGLLGAVLGNAIGSSLDNADRAAYDRASQHAMESGKTRKWRNEDNGHHGSIVPHKGYHNEEGQYCRKYTQYIYIEGKKHQGTGTACRDSNGQWNIVE